MNSIRWEVMTPGDWALSFGSINLLSYDKTFCTSFGREKLLLDLLIGKFQVQCFASSTGDANTPRTFGISGPVGTTYTHGKCPSCWTELDFNRRCKTCSVFYKWSSKVNIDSQQKGKKQFTKNGAFDSTSKTAGAGSPSTFTAVGVGRDPSTQQPPTFSFGLPNQVGPSQTSSAGVSAGTCPHNVKCGGELVFYPGSHAGHCSKCSLRFTQHANAPLDDSRLLKIHCSTCKGLLDYNRWCAQCDIFYCLPGTLLGLSCPKCPSSKGESTRLNNGYCPTCKAQFFKELSPSMDHASRFKYENGECLPLDPASYSSFFHVEPPESVSDASHLGHLAWKYCEFMTTIGCN